jgi:hypothetical protein
MLSETNLLQCQYEMYTFVFSHQTAGQNHNTKTANKSYENVATLEYLGPQ